MELLWTPSVPTSIKERKAGIGYKNTLTTVPSDFKSSWSSNKPCSLQRSYPWHWSASKTFSSSETLWLADSRSETQSALILFMQPWFFFCLSHTRVCLFWGDEGGVSLSFTLPLHQYSRYYLKDIGQSYKRAMPSVKFYIFRWEMFSRWFSDLLS